MSIRIGKPAEFSRLPLAAGAWISLRPMSSVDREAGRIAARRAADAIVEGKASLADYGLGEIGEDLADVDLRLGLGALIALTEITFRCAEAWEGVCDAAGAPLPLARASISALLRDPFYFDLIDSTLSVGVVQVDAEGNVSAPSANGEQAGAQTTATDAGGSVPPAQTDGEA